MVDNKILWIDTETTGLDPKRHGIIQIAGIVDIDGEVKEAFDIKIAPSADVEIDPAALEVHGISEDILLTYPEARVSFNGLQKVMSVYVDRYDKRDKFFMAGYNVHFDEQFIRSFFQRNNNNYYGSWFHWPVIDVATLVGIASAKGALPALGNFKLSTICEHCGISIKAHDALSDIMATRNLYYELMKGL